MSRRSMALLGSVMLSGITVGDAAAQSLAERIASAPAGHVQFTFAARPGICGNGRSYIQTGPGSFTGTFYGSVNDVARAEPCEPGPVRVLIDRAGRDVIALQSFVGPVATTPGATDLGRQSGQAAAGYLLRLAATAEGRIGRDAISAAMYADSASTADALVALARNKALSRETRRGALSSLGRSIEGAGTAPQRVVDALLAVARDEGDNQTVRQQAVSTLGRLEHGAGIPRLIELARDPASAWLAKEATSSLSRSGDPRARTYLREAAQRAELPDDVLAVVIRSLGQEYATQQDAVLLRGLYPRLRTDRTRDAVFAGVAEIGGAENARWLLDRARDEGETVARRRRALDHASRAGIPVAELVKLYDVTGDGQLKTALVSIFVRSGEKVAVDKLLWIVANETNVTVRRQAVSQLSTSSDPRVLEALKGLVNR